MTPQRALQREMEIKARSFHHRPYLQHENPYRSVYKCENCNAFGITEVGAASGGKFLHGSLSNTFCSK